jgi:mitochondrial FAD-linked sulfhydryl oxidase
MSGKKNQAVPSSPPHPVFAGPPSAWGPRGWNWLHLLAVNYPPEPAQEDMRRAFRRLVDFATHLPCAECRDHTLQYLAANSPDLADTYALQAWVWRFHNAVNARLGKRLFPYEEYQALYADEICWANWHPNSCRSAGAHTH